MGYSKTLWFAGVAVSAFLLGLTATKSVVASTGGGYSVVKVDRHWTGQSFHYAKYPATRYMYNLHHTKRLHNLRNYPKTTWHVEQSVLLQNRFGSKSVYYWVANGSGRLRGYVWRGNLTAGKNPRAGYTANSSVDVAYSNVTSAKDKQANDPTDFTVKAPMLTGYESYSKYAVRPTKAQIATVVSFLRNRAAKVSNPGNSAWGKFRIVMRPIASKTSQLKLPFVEMLGPELEDMGNRYENGPLEWSNEGSFWAYYDAAKVPSQDVHTISKTDSSQPFPYQVYSPVKYDLPNLSVMRELNPLGDSDTLYLRPNAEYSIVMAGGMSFVKTANILNFSNGNILKNGILYGLIDPTRQPGKVDQSKAIVYRKVADAGGGFTEYRYRSGKWQEAFLFSIDDDELTQRSMQAQIWQPGQSDHPVVIKDLPVNLSYPSRNLDADFLKTLFLPDQFFSKYLR